MRHFKYFTFSVVTLLLLSCKNDENSLRKSIIGTWDIYASKMNEKPNGLMQNGFFIFTADNLVNSNIFGENQSQPYIVKKNRLVINTEPKFDLEIAKLENDTMYLKGKLSFYYMEYFLTRRK